MAILRLDCRRTSLVVVDIQEKLLPHMHNAGDVVRQTGRLIDGFGVLGLPIIVTEQYRKGLGATVPELAEKLARRSAAAGGAGGASAANGAANGTTNGAGNGATNGGGGHPVPAQAVPAVSLFEKLRFSACIEPVRDDLARAGTRSVLVCGIESHVCVLQTCLDLVDIGYVVFVAADAVGSRQSQDQHWGMARMLQSGVAPTTVESALLELTQEAGGPRFKAMLPIIK